jgi:integrase
MQQKSGGIVKTDKTKFVDFCDRWLKEYSKPNNTPSVYDNYESIIRVHFKPYFKDIQLAKLTRAMIQKYYSVKQDGGLSASTITHHHTQIHKILETAIEWEALMWNPANKATPPKPVKIEMEIWTTDEVQIFLDSVKNTIYYTLFYLALFTGARRSELLGLKWKDVDLVFGQVSINRELQYTKKDGYYFKPPKTAKGRRTIALTPSTLWS